MDHRQKVLLVQLQIASVGLLIGGFGLWWKEWLLAVFGAVILVYGLLRAWMLWRVMEKDPQDSAGEATIDDYLHDPKDPHPRSRSLLKEIFSDDPDDED